MKDALNILLDGDDVPSGLEAADWGELLATNLSHHTDEVWTFYKTAPKNTYAGRLSVRWLFHVGDLAGHVEIYLWPGGWYWRLVDDRSNYTSESSRISADRLKYGRLQLPDCWPHRDPAQRPPAEDRATSSAAAFAKLSDPPPQPLPEVRRSAAEIEAQQRVRPIVEVPGRRPQKKPFRPRVEIIDAPHGYAYSSRARLLADWPNAVEGTTETFFDGEKEQYVTNYRDGQLSFVVVEKAPPANEKDSAAEFRELFRLGESLVEWYRSMGREQAHCERGAGIAEANLPKPPKPKLERRPVIHCQGNTPWDED